MTDYSKASEEIRALAEHDAKVAAQTAPEKFMGVPVPASVAHDWDHVHAIWWRYGVRAAVNDIVKNAPKYRWRLEFDTNPEEGVK